MIVGSATPLFTPSATRKVAVAALALLALFVLAPRATTVSGVGLLIGLYLAALLYRIRRFWLGLRRGIVLEVSDEDARAVPDADLPVYTVLVAVYDEPEVVPRLLVELESLEYPRDRLDVKLLLEVDDDATRVAILEARPSLATHDDGSWIELVTVPAGGPRTKPNALNFGLGAARGELVTIFDAEDRPEPLQLRRAVVAFDRADEDVACLQAKLAYYNTEQNAITRWFSVEYAQWFEHLLPGLSVAGDAIPLGGTSNHLRRKALEETNGWDASNVTEDADLGIRLARAGHRVGVLESHTLEEANSDFVNWSRQRSRWYKGYLETWIVHMRSPRSLLTDLGWRRFLAFNLFVGGTPILAVLNPLFWTLSLIWFIGRPAAIAALFPPGIYWAAMASWTLGNVAVLYTGLLTIRAQRQDHLVWTVLTAPIYWVMMSIAGVKAVVQLVTAPTLWEKTVHGLDVEADVDAAVSA